MKIEIDLTDEECEYIKLNGAGGLGMLLGKKVTEAYEKARNQIKPGDLVKWRTDCGINFGFAVFDDVTGPSGMKVMLEQRLFGIKKATPAEEKLIRPLLEGKK